MNARATAMALVVLGALASAMVGCGPEYDHTDITAVKPTTLGGGLDKTELLVQEGLVVSAHVAPKDDNQKTMGLVLRSLDPSIVEVVGVISDHDFAFLGVKQGRTQIEFKAGDTVVLTIDAQVTPQPSP